MAKNQRGLYAVLYAGRDGGVKKADDRSRPLGLEFFAEDDVFVKVLNGEFAIFIHHISARISLLGERCGAGI